MYVCLYVCTASEIHKKVPWQKKCSVFQRFLAVVPVLPLMFELLNQLHKRAAYLGKAKNFANRTHRLLSKGK
jgi:hypothetical protein